MKRLDLTTIARADLQSIRRDATQPLWRMAKTDASIAATFRTTLDLFETGLALMRQNLRRANPEATDQEIDHRLCQWLHERPGAESGDCGSSLIDDGRL